MRYTLIFCLAALFAGPASAQQAEETFTAKLFNSKGKVEYLKAGSADWVTIKEPYMLEVGDGVRTGGKSKAEIYIKYGAKVRLGADTTFVVKKVSPLANAVEVAKGTMQAWIRKFSGRGFEVRTPSAVCAVRGTVFEVEVAETGQTRWDLFSGTIQIADNMNRTVEMAPNQRLEVTQAAGAAPPAPVAIPENVKPPSEPEKIKEEKAEVKAEQLIETKAKEAAEAVKKEEAKKETEGTEPAEEDVTATPSEAPLSEVSATKELEEALEVEESQEVSGSTP